MLPACAVIVVNGREHSVPLAPDRPLLVVLREELGITGPKYGCGEGVCGACTVLVDGAPARACVTPLGDMAGRSITTVEGLAREGRLHPIQQAFLEVGALQCGYCTPGMILAATALLADDPRPDEDRIRQSLDGNVCRCCTYPRIIRAVRRAAELIDASGDGGKPAGRQGAADAPSPGAPSMLGGAAYDRCCRRILPRRTPLLRRVGEKR